MNKVDLEVKIESLRTMVQESQQSASNYTGQLVEMINDKIQALFKEIECPEDDNSQLNTQTVAKKII